MTGRPAVGRPAYRRGARTALLALAVIPASATCAQGGRVGPGCVDAPRQWTLPSTIPEASGVAVSRRHDGILWVHNDGRDSTLWALAPDATPERSEIAPVARFEVATEMWDWEALEAGSCPTAVEGDSCLWIADTGNNGLYRDVARIQVVAEPDVAPGTEPDDVPRLDALTLYIRYPDARRDVEAMVVVDGVPWLVSKGSVGPPTLYRVPLPPTWTDPEVGGARGQGGPVEPGAGRPPAPGASEANPVTVDEIHELAPGSLNLVRQFTGGSVVPGSTRDGSPTPRLVLRSYTQLRLFTLSDTLARPVDGGEVNLMPLREAQGEGVAVGDDGRVWLVSESGPTAGRGGLSLIRCEELGGG